MDVFIDPRFEAMYQRHPLVLVDVGARGGLKSNWARASRHLRVIGFEPDKREFDRLSEASAPGRQSSIVLDVALHDRIGPLQLNVARDAGLTSIFEPNRAFLDAFPDPERFDTVDVRQVQADTLDNQLHHRSLTDVDFIKVDTQGSELLVLQGAVRALEESVIGVEAEVEFAPIYRDQPLFADVDAFLRGRGFALFDLRPCYWKRASGRALGGPHGQIIWADALYLKTPSALSAALALLPSELRMGKLLRTLSVCLLYGYFDYALEILRATTSVSTAEDRQLIEDRLKAGGGGGGALPDLPGRRGLAAILHRLWRLSLPRYSGWSVSRTHLGNVG